ncbi:hypothetical protein [Pengzhenrongella sp.]|uniref:hypothetical protein n=1 Tax=Pengzhenrongella sp. TaxID=2888820 RepID=UPI002F95F005
MSEPAGKLPGRALRWPPPPAEVTHLRQNAAVLAADPRFTAVRGTWLTVLRPSGAGCRAPEPGTPG